MKRFLILLVVVTTLLVLALGVSAVVAQPAGDTPPFPTYTGRLYTCKQYFTEASKVWDAGMTTHGRNVGQVSYGGWDYKGPVFDNLSWDLNLNTLTGTFSGTTIHELYDESGNYLGDMVGTSVGRLHGEFVENNGEYLLVWLGEGKSVFEGQGAFEGLRVKSEWRQEPYLDQPAPGCEDYLPTGPYETPAQPVVTITENYVIETTGTWPPG